MLVYERSFGSADLKIARHWRNAFTKERVPERVPESEERNRNAFLIFRKERDRNATTKFNARVPFAFLFSIPSYKTRRIVKLLPKMRIINRKYFFER